MSEGGTGPARGIIIAAPASGTGKTTLTLGLLAALSARGVKVGAAKAGPDYIDPAFHTAATGRPSVNLDSWAMAPDLLDTLIHRVEQGVDLVVCEGLMGLFDGVPAADGFPTFGSGATADIAARTGWPVVLVVNAKGQSQSAAALVKGFATYRDDVRIGGVVLNNVGSARHARLCGDAIRALGIPVLGTLPRDASLSLPERHLGLVQAGETPELDRLLRELGDFVMAHLDAAALMSLAQPTRTPRGPGNPALPPIGQRIAVARDAAFTFAYPHLLDGWWREGVELRFFSPLADEPPPADADAVYLPGGYPELHAGRLSGCATFRAGLKAFAETGTVYGECGGYMVLGETLEDAERVIHPMAGLLSHRTSFARRRMHLGYRRAVLQADGPLGRAGDALRGHEFHYATITDPGTDTALFTATAADGTDLGALGGVRGRVSGSFFHIIAAEPSA